jgi:hypothetical protein
VRFWLAGLITLIFAVGVACGGDDTDDSTGDGGSDSGSPAPTAASGTSPAGGAASDGATLQDACTLLSEEEINAALGDDEIAASQGDPPTQANSTCRWDGGNTGNRYVILTLRTAQHGASVFESNYKTAAGAVSISGIGDEAFALPGMDTPNNYRFLTAAALTSSLYIQVNIAGPNRSNEEALAVLTNVLQQVVAKLG